MSEMNRDEYLAKNASKLTEMVNPNLPQETVSEEVAISASRAVARSPIAVYLKCY